MRAAAAACLLALLATACIDMEMTFLVHEDGSGSIATTVHIDEDVLVLLAAMGEAPAEDSCEQYIRAGDDIVLSFIGWATSFGGGKLTIDSEGRCAATLVTTWTADETDATLAAIAARSSDTGFMLRHLDDGGWRFEVETDVLDDEGFSLDDAELVTAMGFDFPTLAVAVTLPGNAVEHNADSVSQSTYTWEIDLGDVDELPETLYVETAPSSGLGPEAIGAIVAGIVLTLAALVTLRRHRNAKAADSEDAESAREPTEDWATRLPDDGESPTT